MDQLLKLHKELAEGKKEVDGMKSDIKVLEQELKAQDLMLQGQAPKIVVSDTGGTHVSNAWCCLELRVQYYSIYGIVLSAYHFDLKNPMGQKIDSLWTGI